MTIFGYVRKNYPDGTIEQLQRVMDYECEKIFIEEELITVETELNQLVAILKKSDTLVVDSLCTFGKTLPDMNVFFELLSEKEVRLISLKESIDTQDDQSIYKLVQVIFNVNKQCQSIQIREGIKASKDSGMTFGRPSLDEETIKKIQKLHKHDKLSMRTIACECGVSLGSVHKYIQENNPIVTV